MDLSLDQRDICRNPRAGHHPPVARRQSDHRPAFCVGLPTVLCGPLNVPMGSVLVRQTVSWQSGAAGIHENRRGAGNAPAAREGAPYGAATIIVRRLASSNSTGPVNEPTSSRNTDGRLTSFPSTRRTKSPARRPAFQAGDWGSTDNTPRH